MSLDDTGFQEAVLASSADHASQALNSLTSG
jgi:hypothetical protein